VFALRKALGDTAESEQYIETVPKRGYRFVAIVSPTAPRSPQPAAAEGSASSRSFPGWKVWAGGALTVAVAWLAAWAWRVPEVAETPMAFPLTSFSGVVRAPSLSPDGRHVVFSWNGVTQDNQDADPVISPDGRTLVFRRDTTPFTGSFYRRPLTRTTEPAGDEVRLTPTLGAGKATWMPGPARAMPRGRTLATVARRRIARQGTRQRRSCELRRRRTRCLLHRPHTG
jgi:hypothetical protein